MAQHGTLYWVGTGPGHPGLITVKGMALVAQADAIVGNVLEHAQLLQSARPDARIVDVGSISTGNKLPQHEVNRLLIDLAAEVDVTVRLWSGDPFVFGRAVEEMTATRQANIRVELVPGVTSAVAAPAYAGVPVTAWENATSFGVVTGYLPEEAKTKPDWQALARLDTVVVLMPLENLPEIVAELRQAGLPPETPTLVVQHGSTPEQRQVVTTLATVTEAVERHQIERHAIMVVGHVVRWAETLRWFTPGDYPLLGKRVLVTRPLHQAGSFVAALRTLGAEPIAYPTIEIHPAEESSPLDVALERICRFSESRLRDSEAVGYNERPYHWLVLTSVNGVHAVWERMRHLNRDSRGLATVKIASIGPATTAALQSYSIMPELVPDEYTAEGILAMFDRLGPVNGQRFLLARADIARKALADGLQQRGAEIEEVTAYRTVPRQDGPPPPYADIVTFTSSSTVQGYVNCLAGRSPAETLAKSKVICIGPVTAATARELQLPVHGVAAKYTIDGILEKLTETEGPAA
jgi:uroporphyrinogen III methyltransferase/synthase